MKQFQLDKLKTKKLDSKGYLRAIEKRIMEKKKIRTLEEMGIFRLFIKDHHTEEEIDMMINELELTTTKNSDYIKLFYSTVTPLLVTFFSIISVVIVFLFNSDFQLALKMAEVKQIYQQMDVLELLRSFLMMWLSILIIVICSSSFLMWELPKKKLLYLSILKSIKN
ncbi:hypothetical protein JNUCC23_08855 [Peribacillus sp. JNUCC 23]